MVLYRRSSTSLTLTLADQNKKIIGIVQNAKRFMRENLQSELFTEKDFDRLTDIQNVYIYYIDLSQVILTNIITATSNSAVDLKP